MDKKLKINFLLYNPALGGGDRVVSIHAKYLRQKGHDVTVTALKPKNIPLRRKIKHYLRTGAKLKEGFSTAHYDKAGVPLNLVTGQTEVLDKNLPDADVLISTLWLTAEWAINIHPSKGKKAYFVQGHEIFPHFPKDRVQATYRAPFHKIVVAKWLERTMRDEYASPAIACVPNSVDTALFYASQRSKSDRPCIGFLYSDGWVKGVDVTLDAINKIKRALPDIKIVSFGASTPKRHLPLPDHCEFHYKPPQDKIREIYAQCDVWMCGSRLEGFHLPPMEAMACRTPVVSTTVGGPEDVIENGRQGFVVPIEDADALAEKTLNVLHADKSAWRLMSEAAYETAVRYSWDDAGALFEAALYKIAGETENVENA